jgi:hypothetical protein
MRYFLVITVMMTATLGLSLRVGAQGVGIAEASSPLSDAKWNRRILFICTAIDEPESAPFMQAQYDRVDWAGFLDRDLMVVWATQNDLTSITPHPHPTKAATLAWMYHEPQDANLLKRTSCSGEDNFVALIGKDGGVKARWDNAVSNEDLFAIIDAMPMRQSEMRAAED